LVSDGHLVACHRWRSLLDEPLVAPTCGTAGAT
jgi:hypothetical protein